MTTSYDVARLAGVSQPTVSRVMRGGHHVSQKTREEVLAAAVSLGYVPSSVGRNLSTRSSGRIGIVASELTNPFYPALVAPLHASLSAAGYTSVLLTSADQSMVPGLTSLVDGSVDGVILTSSVMHSSMPGTLRRANLPFVQVNRTIDGERGDTVVFDNAAGAKDVADLLVDLGHERIAYIAGASNASTSRDRVASFVQQLAERGTPVPRRYQAAGSFTTEAGAQGFAHLMRATPAPTAVFCANDVIAIGALNEAVALGISVPNEVSIVGFDDIPQASWNVLQLTTVRARLSDMAAVAVELLASRIHAPDAEPEHRVLPVQLVHRSTHAATCADGPC